MEQITHTVVYETDEPAKYTQRKAALDEYEQAVTLASREDDDENLTLTYSVVSSPE